MRRREFIALVGGLGVWPLATTTCAEAQQSKPLVIGFLSSSKLETYRTSVEAFYRGLAEVGYEQGRNIDIGYRVSEDHNDRLPALASDLVGRRVAVIATFGNLAAAVAAKTATETIPIVFVMGADPIANKVVTNLARPEANITGATLLAGELFWKRLALLRELVPSATRIGFVVNYSNSAYSKDAITTITIARARELGVELLPINATNPGEIDEAYAILARQQAGAVMVGPDTFLSAQRDQLVALAARNRIPAFYSLRDFVESGGLASYSSERTESFRQAGIYVGRILKGERPADLPVMQPTKFELLINLKTAKALDLAVPSTLLARADEVIE